jgi:phosphoribosylformylglycinamidine (FGAM) synthase PurS component
MYEIELLVSLKIPDVTALTAANTLRRRMGYAERLLSLRRADYYSLEVEAESEQAARRLVTELAERTNHFVNPNKPRFTVRRAELRVLPPARGEGWEVEVVVSAAEGDRSAALEAALATDPTAPGRVKAVHTGVLWILLLKAEGGPEAMELARDIAITRSRERGLLANPHFQEVRVS